VWIIRHGILSVNVTTTNSTTTAITTATAGGGHIQLA
jgi:hypothetical protein